MTQQRLPVPGSDEGHWGDILNGFLGVEHDPTGNLKIRTDGTLSTVATSGSYVDLTNKPTIPLSNLTISGTPSNGTALVASSSSAASWTTATDSLAVHHGDLVNNVKDFGALGDNSTDDTAAIQAALNAGGITFLPAANYSLLGTLTIPVGAILKGVNGSGSGVIPNVSQRSVLRRANGSSGTFIRLPAGTGPVIIEDLEIDGRSQPGTLISFDDASSGEECQAKLNRLYVHDSAVSPGFAGGDGIYVGVNRRAVYGNWVLCRSIGRYSFNIQGSDTEWHACTSDGASYHGWVLNGAVTRVIGGQSFGNGSAPGAASALNVSAVSTTGNPTTITTSAAHGLSSNQMVFISGVGGAGAANGVFTITVTGTTTFTIVANNSSAYTSGGTVQPMAAALWVPTNAGPIQISDHGVDRNWFSGIVCDIACSAVSIMGCNFNSNGQQADALWSNIEVNAQNGNVTIVGNMHTAQAVGYPNRPQYNVVTRNGSTWRDMANVSGTSSTSQYTNATQLYSNSFGGTTVNAYNTGKVGLTVRATNGQTADLFDLTDGNGVVRGLRFDNWGRPVSAGATPTITPAANAGAGATATVTGNDVSGTVTLTTGSTGLGATSMFTLTFSNAFSGAPRTILFPVGTAGPSTWAAQMATSSATTGVTAYNAAAPAASTTYTWAYLVIG